MDGTAKTKGLLKPDKFALIWGYAENKSPIFGVLKKRVGEGQSKSRLKKTKYERNVILQSLMCVKLFVSKKHDSQYAL